MYNLQQSYQDRMELLQDRLNQERQQENPASYFQDEETSATTSTARSPSTPILQESSDASISLTPQALKTTQKPVDAGFVLEIFYRRLYMAKLCQIRLIRSTQGDTEVTFGRFFHFFHTKSEIPIKSKFELNPTLGFRKIVEKEYQI